MTTATSVVADTQILIWYVIDPDRLTADAVAALEAATAAEEPICVSAHSLVELVYAVEKATNPLTEDDRQAILDELARDESPFEVVPVTAEIANQVASVPRADNADPADRIIVATAEVLGLALISSDRHIPSMTANTVIW
jgi:PIN domain nuclease of toxin-antitoxin system